MNHGVGPALAKAVSRVIKENPSRGFICVLVAGAMAGGAYLLAKSDKENSETASTISAWVFGIVFFLLLLIFGISD